MQDSGFMGAGGINFNNSDIELSTTSAPADAGQDMSMFFSEVWLSLPCSDDEIEKVERVREAPLSLVALYLCRLMISRMA
jgi:hypothetical protein